MDVLAEGILEYTMNGREPERNGNRDPLMAPHQLFRCVDLPEKILDVTIDQWVAIVCADDSEWARLARAIGKPELANDPRFATLAARKENEDALEAIVSAWTGTRRVAYVVDTLQAAGVAAGACADSKYLSEDKNLTERILCVPRAFGSREATALRNSMAHERDARRSEGRGTRARATY